MNRRQFGRAAAAAAAFPFNPAPAQRVDKYAEQLTNGEFNWYPERSETGPIIAIVSLPDQRVYVYRNGGPHRRLVVLDRQTRPPNADGRV